MKPAETEKLYKRACASRRMQPEQEEGRAWHRTLRGYEARDVEAALDAWDADATDEGRGPRGKWMPTAADLKPLVEAAQRKREATAREPKDMLFWRCEKGHPYSGFIAKGQLAPAKRCPSCGTPMTLEHREAA